MDVPVRVSEFYEPALEKFHRSEEALFGRGPEVPTQTLDRTPGPPNLPASSIFD
jgi:hypothetical protein